MQNLKWCVVSERSTVSNIEIYKTMEEAVSNAVREWNHLSINDKKYSRVIAGTCNIDEEEQFYYCDDNGNVDADIYEIAWDSDVNVERGE